LNEWIKKSNDDRAPMPPNYGDDLRHHPDTFKKPGESGIARKEDGAVRSEESQKRSEASVGQGDSKNF